MTTTIWRSVLKAEIHGLFYCIKHTLPHMRREQYGRINALSMAGAERLSGPPFDYNLGKASRHTPIKSLAAHEIQNGITCNVIAPGHTPRSTLRQAVDAAKHSPTWKRRLRAHPQDIAEVVRFLCSDEAAFVTGSVIELTGSPE